MVFFVVVILNERELIKYYKLVLFLRGCFKLNGIKYFDLFFFMIFYLLNLIFVVSLIEISDLNYYFVFGFFYRYFLIIYVKV